MRRWPAWRLDERHVGLYQADAGIADPSQGNAAHRALAIAAGARLRDRTPVTRVGQTGGTPWVEVGGGEHIAAGHVILATDSWTNALLEPLGLGLPLTITREQVSWFAPAGGDPILFRPDRFPIWIWMDEPSFYGFPAHGHPGPKIGQDVGGREVTHATRTFERDEAANARVMAFLATHLPALAVEPFLTRTCLYALTPDRDFVVDTLPGLQGVSLLLGSAHAYKFASLLGRIAVELALDGATPSAPDLAGFRIDRPALQPGRPRTFVV
jgi:sarcosine oxidase